MCASFRLLIELVSRQMMLLYIHKSSDRIEEKTNLNVKSKTHACLIRSSVQFGKSKRISTTTFFVWFVLILMCLSGRHLSEEKEKENLAWNVIEAQGVRHLTELMRKTINIDSKFSDQ